eukprot:10615921-Ditylum_brightwellii.AAC.1
MSNDKGIPNTILSVKCRVADIINLPYLLSNSVRDASGQLLLPLSHLCNSGMEQSMKVKRQPDGYSYNAFHIDYKEEQNPSFLAIRNDLTGFNLLSGCYSDSDGELCDFKLLQVVTKEKDNLMHQKGKAVNVDCGIFGSPVALSVPPPLYHAKHSSGPPPPPPYYFSSAGASNPPYA